MSTPISSQEYLSMGQGIVLIVSSGLLSTLVTIIVGWIKEIVQTRKEERKRLFEIKESAYREVMKNIDFIYSGTDLSLFEVTQKKYSFLQNYRLMFLYADDEVVREINAILDTMTSQPEDNALMKAKKEKVSSGMLAIRKKIIKHSRLSKEDFMHVV